MANITRETLSQALIHLTAGELAEYARGCASAAYVAHRQDHRFADLAEAQDAYDAYVASSEAADRVLAWATYDRAEAIELAVDAAAYAERAGVEPRLP